MNSKLLKKLGALAIALAMVLTLVSPPATLTSQAAKSKLSCKSATIYVKQTFKLKLNNTKQIKKVTWTSGANVSLGAKSISGCTVVGKKKGTTSVVATIIDKNGKSYTLKCIVTVKKDLFELSDKNLTIEYSVDDAETDVADEIPDADEEGENEEDEDEDEEEDEEDEDEDDDEDNTDEDEDEDECDEVLTGYYNGKEISGNKITWTTSDPKVVTITNGELHVISLGTATITAKYKKLTATCKITVTAPSEEDESEDGEE